MISVEKPGSPLEILEHLDTLDLGKEIVLEHFGTKGMKWGVRQKEQASGIVKSLKEKNSARKEKNAKGHIAEANRAQKKIDEIKANPSRWPGVKQYRKGQVKELEHYRDTHLKAAKDIREGHLTDHQKHVIVGVAVVGGVLAAYGTYKAFDSGTVNQFLSRNKSLKTNDLLSRKMSTDSIMKEVVSPINPDYLSKPGSAMNCRRCTFAYEMRRRGYDVEATKTLSGTGQHPTSLLTALDSKAKGKWGSFWEYGKEVRDREDNPTKAIGPMQHFLDVAHGMGKTPIGDKDFRILTPSAKSATIFNSLSKNPEGARGELGMKWHFGGAHSMAWEIIGGKPVIFDTQTGKSYTSETFDEIARRMNHAASTRLDDQPLNNEFLRRWIRNVK